MCAMIAGGVLIFIILLLIARSKYRHRGKLLIPPTWRECTTNSCVAKFSANASHAPLNNNLSCIGSLSDSTYLHPASERSRTTTVETMILSSEPGDYLSDTSANDDGQLNEEFLYTHTVERLKEVDTGDDIYHELDKPGLTASGMLWNGTPMKDNKESYKTNSQSLDVINGNQPHGHMWEVLSLPLEADDASSFPPKERTSSTRVSFQELIEASNGDSQRSDDSSPKSEIYLAPADQNSMTNGLGEDEQDRYEIPSQLLPDDEAAKVALPLGSVIGQSLTAFGGTKCCRASSPVISMPDLCETASPPQHTQNKDGVEENIYMIYGAFNSSQNESKGEAPPTLQPQSMPPQLPPRVLPALANPKPNIHHIAPTEILFEDNKPNSRDCWAELADSKGDRRKRKFSNFSPSRKHAA